MKSILKSIFKKGKSLTRKELAAALNLSPSSLYRHLKKKGYKSNGELLTAKQIMEIIELLGY